MLSKLGKSIRSKGLLLFGLSYCKISVIGQCLFNVKLNKKKKKKTLWPLFRDGVQLPQG